VDKLNKNFFHAFIVAIILVGLLFVSALVMMIVPVKVLKFTDNEYPIINTAPIHPGDIVTYRERVWKYKEYPVTINKQLINSYVYHYTPVDGYLPTGFSDKLVPMQLPLYIEPGLYFFRIVYTYKINPLKVVTYIMTTEEFMVVK
jgi:hypothetical protein